MKRIIIFLSLLVLTLSLTITIIVMKPKSFSKDLDKLGDNVSIYLIVDYKRKVVADFEYNDNDDEYVYECHKLEVKQEEVLNLLKDVKYKPYPDNVKVDRITPNIQ